MRSFLLFIFLLLPLAAHADAAQDDARAQHLFAEVRCVACQGQSIGDSDAAIAADMRREIRAEIAAGRTDDAIRKNLSGIYGDYVLFRPRLSMGNLILWGLPPLIVLLGGALLMWLGKRQSKTRDYALSQAETKKLRDILKRKE